jgi:hypothetical protein
VTAAADLYALGVVLYELCTGRGPFLADNPIVMILAHTRQEAPRPGGMPDALWAVLSGLLAKDPTVRPTADRVARTLREILPGLAGLPACTPPPPLAPPSLDDAGAPATVASAIASVTTAQASGLAPATIASPVGRSTPGPVPDTGPVPALLGEMPPTAQPLSRRDRHSPAPGPRRPGPPGGGAPPGTGGPFRRPVVLAAAAAGAVLLLVLAGIGVVAALDRSDSTVTVAPTVPAPEPTGPTASAPPDSTPTPSDSGAIQTIVQSPTQAPGGRPSASKGSSSASPTPTPSPGIPTLTRKEPTSEEQRSTEGKVTLVLGGVSAGTGTVASISVLYDGQVKPVTVQAATVTSYEVTIDGLKIGTPYSFTAKVCNAAKLCSTTASAFDFTPYGALQVQPPSIKVSGQTVTITVPALERNGNPFDSTCVVDLSATPTDANAPHNRRVWYGGDTVSYDGKASTTYKATLTCATAGVDNGSASSGTVTTAAAPPPSPTPTTSVTPSTAAALVGGAI